MDVYMILLMILFVFINTEEVVSLTEEHARMQII